MRAYVRENSPVVPRARPVRSNARDSSAVDSRTTRAAMTTAAAPMGTLRRKIDSHLTFSTSQPPAVGPSASASPETPAQMPMAFARSLGGKVTVRIDREPGMSSAAPTPWMARKEMSCPVDWARPHANEASVNTARPATNTRFRPKRSPAIPPVSSRDAKAST
jgi:hypothetical protein